MKSEIAPKRVLKNLSWLAFFVVALSFLVEMAQAEQHLAEQHLAPERRRPLSQMLKRIRGGTDLTIRRGGMASSCQSTLVAKKALENPSGMCKLGYLTAAHCVDSKVDSKVDSISFAGIGRVPRHQMKISIPSEYYERGVNSRGEVREGDSATIIFDAACDKVSNLIPVPLAPTDRQGNTIINSNSFYLQKREGQAPGNRGEGAQIQANLWGTESSLLEFHAPSPQGYAIVGGDSGGPIYNDKGELICPISGSEYEFKRRHNLLQRLPDGTPDKVLDPFTVVCDRRAIARLRAELASAGLSPVSVAEAEELSQNRGPQRVGTGEPRLNTPENPGGAFAQQGRPNNQGNQGLQNYFSNPLEGGCEGGSCRHLPLGNGPQAQRSAPPEAIPNGNSGGLKELGPIRRADLNRAFEDAKNKGFKHIIVKYGDATCKYCRLLGGELRNLFGRDNDILVIKVEGSVPNPEKDIIPQSELYALGERGAWDKLGETQFGSGVGEAYRDQIQALRARRQQRPQGPHLEVPPLSHQSPRQEEPARPQPQAPQKESFQFEPNGDRTGLQYRRQEDPEGSPSSIILKRMPDGTRRAARKEADGRLSFLTGEAEKALKQYYQANREKIEKLSPKQQKHIEDFLRSPEQASHEGAIRPQQNQPQQQQLPQQRQPQSTSDAEAAKAIDYYEKGMRYFEGTPREYFPPETFKDIPKGGTGQIILAYFGPKDRQLEEAAQKHPYIEVRNYRFGSPEHRHASLFGTQALGLDGLGRKITRYAMSPREAFNSLAASDEVDHLKRYLDAKRQSGGESHPEPLAQNPRRRLEESRPPQPQPRAEQAEHPPVESGTVAAILEGKCIQCHQKISSLDDSFKNTKGLLNNLRSATDATLDDMARRAQLSIEEKNKLKAFKNQGTSSSSHSSRRSPSGGSRVGEAKKRKVAENGVTVACYSSDGERRSRIENLPEFQVAGSPIASAVNEALNSGQAVFYDSKSVPRTWHGFGRGLVTEKNGNRTNPKMYSQMGYHSDGSSEFPWNKPAGTDASGDTTSSEKFFIPGNNRQLASVVSRSRSNSPSYFGKAKNINGPSIGWNYEKGATFGEVLKVADPETGENIPFEIRLRRKINEGTWQMDVLRPFENASDLLAGLKKLCIESKNPPAGCARLNWSSLEKPDVRVFDKRAFVNQQTLGTRLDPLKLSSTAATALAEKASLQVLPNMPPDVVRALLKTTPFKSVFGKPWTEAQNGMPEGWAPTSNSNFNIVPKNYFGGFIAMNQVSCMKCHESAGRHVDNFDPKLDRAAGIVSAPNDAFRSRTWYDFLPGNDGILSFHPYDARKAAQRAPASLQSLSDCLKRSGLIKGIQ